MPRIALSALVFLTAAALLIPSASGSSKRKARTWQVTITKYPPPMPKRWKRSKRRRLRFAA